MSRTPAVFSCGGLLVDPTRHEMMLNGTRVALTATEFRLLEVLVQRARRCAEWVIGLCARRNFAVDGGSVGDMPERETVERARRDAAQGKSPSTQAGEFVREQIRHIRQGQHGARSTKQAIAIGLSEARRAGVPLAPPKGRGPTTRKARQDLAAGKRPHRTSGKRSRATTKALQREGRSAASHTALSRQAKQAARKRGAADRSRAAKKAAATRRKRSGAGRGRRR